MPGARALLADAGERGARAQWLLAVDWEPLLAQPIDEVREALRIGQPPRYQRYVRSPSGFGLEPESAA